MDITFKDVSYTYQPGTPFQGIGLKHINLTIESGSYTALIDVIATLERVVEAD